MADASARPSVPVMGASGVGDELSDRSDRFVEEVDGAVRAARRQVGSSGGAAHGRGNVARHVVGTGFGAGAPGGGGGWVSVEDPGEVSLAPLSPAFSVTAARYRIRSVTWDRARRSCGRLPVLAAF